MTSQSTSDMSLRELFLKIQSYISTVFSHWLLICFFGFGFAIVFLMATYNIKPEYKANLTYMLNDDESNGLSSIGAVLGQFGFGFGTQESNFDKIIELSRTRRITQNALFVKHKLYQKEDYLANHLIHALENANLWEKKGLFSFLGFQDSLSLRGFKFTHHSFKDFSLLENKALKTLHKFMVGKEKQGQLFRSNYSSITGIMSFSMTSTEPELSIAIVKSMYDKLSDYYIEKAVEKQKADYLIIKSKYDSITSELSKVQYSIAKNTDTNQGLIYEVDKLINKKQLENERRLLLMLGEAEKQKQLSELTLGSNTHYIQIIDTPILPLKRENKPPLLYFLIGGFFGGVFAIFFILIRKVYRDIMYA